MATVYERGAPVDFYLVDPSTRRGLPVRPGEVVEDRGGLFVSVRDAADDEIHLVPSGHLWPRRAAS